MYPYLLRNLSIERPDQVWGVDITYLRLRGGFLYLVAFLDWFSRLVAAWELSEALELAFVLACADAVFGRAIPGIINSDQGSHFTSERYTGRVRAAGAQVSMNGRGRYVDNSFTERLWRSVKYEEVYLTDYETLKETLILRKLRRRVGPVPDTLTARLDTLTAGQLDDLGEALLDFRTVADLQQWLDQYG